jgi:hypothetical protein
MGDSRRNVSSDKFDPLVFQEEDRSEGGVDTRTGAQHELLAPPLAVAGDASAL